MNNNPQSIAIADYDYPLPDDRIAKFPLECRDHSKLLVYRGGDISESRFDHIPELLPPDTLLIFNNTKVIHARLFFRKQTGSTIVSATTKNGRKVPSHANSTSTAIK